MWERYGDGPLFKHEDILVTGEAEHRISPEKVRNADVPKVGLPAEKADQIFNAFVTTKPHGSGMGLTISRSIVESHGGRLWATPGSGRGAIFQFILPIAG